MEDGMSEIAATYPVSCLILFWDRTGAGKPSPAFFTEVSSLGKRGGECLQVVLDAFAVGALWGT